MWNSLSRLVSTLVPILRPSIPDTTLEAPVASTTGISEYREADVGELEGEQAGSVGTSRGNFIDLTAESSEDEEVKKEEPDSDDDVIIMEIDESKRRKAIREGKKRAIEENDDFARNQYAPSPAVTSKPSSSDLNRQLPTPNRTRKVSLALPISSPASSIVPDSSPPSPADSTRGRFITPEFALPSPPASPAPVPRRTPFPLATLVPVGTIVLEDVKMEVDYEGVEAEDGWIPFSEDLLVPYDTFSLDDSSDSEESNAPSLSSAQAGKKRGRASGGLPARSKKKAKVVGNKLLDQLITCSETFNLRATVKLVGWRSILRIYLIPEDLPERIQLAKTKNGNFDRPPALVSVLSLVRRNQLEWDGRLQRGAITMLMEEPDTRSLLEIFQQVERPGQDGFDKLEASEEVKARLEKAVTSQPDKVKTKLYLYQQASVAKILARELAPQHVVSPFFLPRTSLIDPSKKVYVSLQTGQVLTSPPRLLEPKAGILAENMGDGKSLIVLALVISTLRELPSLEGTSIYKDGSPSDRSPVVLTRQSIDFPFKIEQEDRRRTRLRRIEAVSHVAMTPREEEENERALAAQAQLDLEDSQHHPPLPSLHDLMINLLRTTRNLSRRDKEAIARHNETHIKQLNLKSIESSPPFYRTFPTPQLLKSRQGRQWVTDQHNPKFVGSYATVTEKRRAALKSPFSIVEIYVTSATLLVVPSVLIKQWIQEIDTHLEPDSLSYLVLKTGNKIPSPEQLTAYDLVLVSGDTFSAIASAASNSNEARGREDAKKFKLVHWKRLVVDEGHILGNPKLSDAKILAEALRCECRWAISGTPTTNLRGDANDTTPPTTTSLFGGDRDDYSRLARLYSHFLRHPAFPTIESLTQLVTSLADRPSRIAGVLSKSVVRHRSDVIKQYRSLPELRIIPVYITMEEAERKMYNTLCALFAANSITTQRNDKEYFFHKKQTGRLAEISTNLAASTTFYTSSDSQDFLRHGVDESKRHLNLDSSRRWSSEDRAGLRKVIRVVEEALRDVEVGLIAGELSVAIEVRGVEEKILETFGGLRAAVTQSESGGTRALLSTRQLVRLRRSVAELSREDVKDWDDHEDLIDELITAEKKRQHAEANASKKARVKPDTKKRFKVDSPKIALPDNSSLLRIELVRTTSSKINHILSEFGRYPDAKFIIFSSSLPDLLFANLSEVLDLFGISHIILTGKYKGSGLDATTNVQQFNSTSVQECKAILVDAEKGGRGVHLTAASRIIMLEPIWKPDLEVQATKRAHRLGQTKPVDVQILIVKNTYEDKLFERRQKIAPREFTTSTKQPHEDSALKEVLQSAEYLPRREEGAADQAPLTGSPHFLFPRFNDDDAMSVD
ncbi:hypothetical protein JCM5353_005679 [Sporobolomyces roseus]